MPELPELEVVCEVLDRRVKGAAINGAETFKTGATVIRDLTTSGFAAALLGREINTINRRGKFLILRTEHLDPADAAGPIYLVINPKLTGRLQLARPGDKRHARTAFILTLSTGDELRYFDQRSMGQVYLVREFSSLPDFAGMGPEPLAISEEDFRARLRGFRGEIKGILTRGEFVAGIGNAYADEILWAARLHPYRKRTQMSTEEVDRLYDAMRTTLVHATEKVRAEMGDRIELKPRDFLAVHLKTGEPCPRCGTAISLVGANQRITNFCRRCQPGGLIKGM